MMIRPTLPDTPNYTTLRGTISVHRISLDNIAFLWEPSRRSPDVATNYGLDRGFGVTLRPRYGLQMRLERRRI